MRCSQIEKGKEKKGEETDRTMLTDLVQNNIVLHQIDNIGFKQTPGNKYKATYMYIYLYIHIQSVIILTQCI